MGVTALGEREMTRQNGHWEDVLYDRAVDLMDRARLGFAACIYVCVQGSSTLTFAPFVVSRIFETGEALELYDYETVVLKVDAILS